MKNRLAERTDEWGAHLLMLFGSLSLFLLLWGVRLPSFTAGAALYVFLLLLRKTGKAQRLRKKEQWVRRQLGGELALERLLVQPSHRAHYETALVLEKAFRLSVGRITDDGVLCRQHGQPVLVHFLQMHRDDELTGEAVARAQRLCKEYDVSGVWLCVPSRLSTQAREQCALYTTVRLLPREQLIRLFGAAFPATDSQLVMLSRRRQKPMKTRMWLHELFRPDNAPRLARYAALMAGLYFITGQRLYALSAVGMMALSALCRIPRKTKTLPEGSA